MVVRYRALLTPQELERNARYYFTHDRLRDLVTRACVRTVLSRYVAQVAPSEWCFEAGAHGRPTITNQEATLIGCALDFNISHSGRLVLVAVTCNAALGVDVECTTRSAPLNIAADYFSAAERAMLLSRPEAERPESFYRLWTLKESYIKARGLGLSLPLRSFAFTLPPDGPIVFSTDISLADAPTRWSFLQWRVARDHLAALCVERKSSTPVSLVVRRVVPLVEDSIMSVAGLIASRPAG
jgi:4'-phosphopantetheinyl transferase